MSIKTLQKVTILLDWSPNTNYLGVYAARDKGFFEEEGLEVSPTQIGGDSVASLVGSGKAEFGYSYQELITLARSEKYPVPIVAIAAVLQHNTTGFAGLRSSGIKTPKDFEGKRYGTLCYNCVWECSTSFENDMEHSTLDDVMSAFGGDVKKIISVAGKYGALKNDLSQDVQTFCQGIQKNIFDFAWIFEGWEGIDAQIQKLDLFYIPLVEISPIFDYYVPVIISSEKYIAENRDTTMRFMRALKKGYEWSVENPEEAATILYEAEPSLDENLVLKSAEFLASKFIDDAPSWGVMKQEPWDNYTKWLQEKGLISNSFSIEGAFTNEFVNQK